MPAAKGWGSVPVGVLGSWLLDALVLVLSTQQ